MSKPNFLSSQSGKRRERELVPVPFASQDSSVSTKFPETNMFLIKRIGLHATFAIAGTNERVN